MVARADGQCAAPWRRFLVGLGERPSHRRSAEERLDLGLVGTRAQQIGAAPVAEQKAERPHQDRLPGAGLPGDDVQPGLEGDLEILDDREIADAQTGQHRARCP